MSGRICIEGCPIETAGSPLDVRDPEEWAEVLDRRGIEAAHRGNYDLASDLLGAAEVIRKLMDRVDYVRDEGVE